MSSSLSYDEEVDVSLDEKLSEETAEFYKIIIHNDDVTTVDFVIYVLVHYFSRSMEDAIRLTYDVHTKGSGIAGTGYIYDIAETKVHQVTSLADHYNFPLLLTIEPE